MTRRTFGKRNGRRGKKCDEVKGGGGEPHQKRESKGVRKHQSQRNEIVNKGGRRGGRGTRGGRREATKIRQKGDGSKKNSKITREREMAQIY